MITSIKKLMMAMTALLLSTATYAQIKNAKTETVTIYGNCDMCKSVIEKSGYAKKAAKVNWDKSTNTATLTYDSTKTDKDEILKRIALAGYDNETFLAPDDAYAQLHGCCKYDRVGKAAVKNTTTETNEDLASVESTSEVSQGNSPLKEVSDDYFAVKDALVNGSASKASEKATALLKAINSVKMQRLSTAEHGVWMKVMKDLSTDATKIADAKGLDAQRGHFMSLSKNMYELLKSSKSDSPVYYQFCPMANGGKGANWLSKDSDIKNPYYGATMLTCGKTVETLK